MRQWFIRSLCYLAGAVAAAGLMSVAFLLFSNWWVHHQGRSGTYDALAEVPSRAYAIVPGVGDRDGIIGDRFRSRLVAGLSLYRSHKVQAILVSGVGVRPNGGDEVSSARIWLLAHGVDPAHVLTDRAGFRTLDTMQRAANVFGVTSAIVCSQAQHLDRSLFLARAAGIDAVGFIADMHDKITNFEVRLETMKASLAFVDTYVLHRGPRVIGPVGIVASAL